MNEIGTQIKPTKKTLSPVKSKKSPFFGFNPGETFFQSKLTVGKPNDHFEREADQMADQVMESSETAFIQPKITSISIQRKCAECEKDEEEKLQGKKSNDKEADSLDSLIVDEALSAPGQTLDHHTRSFMESRMGYDFSKVRIHNNNIAAKSAKSINALAYTTGNDIVFNKGQYAPGTDDGKRLLAHELTHVIQQSRNINRKVIQRCPDAASTSQFDARASQVRAHPQYAALSSSDQTITEEIISLSRNRDDCIHFIDRLLILFNTPVDQSPAVGSAATAIIANAADEERARLATPEGSRLRNIEEDTVSDPSRNFETISPPARTWGHMATFRIDRSDPNNLVVQAKIHVTGDSSVVSNIVAQEDGIEKAALEMGYTLDIIFVDTPGPDVFSVTVNPALPVTAGNWSAYDTDPSGYTHEIHHLLGLEDRYDYTSHAYNTRMTIHNRLHWFRIEAGRPRDALEGQSLMGSGSHLLDDDICRVSQLDFNTCMTARQARRDAVTRARTSAFHKCFRVFEILSGIRAPSPYGDEMQQMERRLALLKARTIFGEDLNEDQLLEIVSSMRHRLTPGIPLRFAPGADSNCAGNAYYVVNMIPPISLCPDFFALSVNDQIKSFLRAAAQLVRIDDSIPAGQCPNYDCYESCGSFNYADSWAKYIWCASEI